MSSAWWGVSRAAAAVLAGSGFVYAAAQVPGTVSLTPAEDQPSVAAATSAPVSASSLTCPGPETEGLPGVPAVKGTTTVYAASPPVEALRGIAVGPGSGSVSIAASPSGTNLGATDKPGVVVQTTLTGTSVGTISGAAALAPGLSALQTSVSTQGDDRAAVAAPCLAARADLWLVGGGSGSTRRERVVLTNPGANPVSADVTVLGVGGLLPSANGQDVAVPPHGRASLLVDALVGPEASPVVHVVATGGVITAVLEDSWIDAATGRGADDAIPAADPGTEQVIPAVFLDGPARLRIAVPGSDETVVQARALTTEGPTALPGDGVVRVAGGSVRELDLSALPAGSYAVQVRADHPVVAGVMAERRPGNAQQSDFGWTTSTASIPVMSGTPLPPEASGVLMLVGTGGPSNASVFTVDASGAVESHAYSLVADSITTLDVSKARQVWVRPTSGTVRAGLSLSFAAPDAEPLFSLVPLQPAIVSALQVPVRQLPG